MVSYIMNGFLIFALLVLFLLSYLILFGIACELFVHSIQVVNFTFLVAISAIVSFQNFVMTFCFSDIRQRLK